MSCFDLLLWMLVNSKLQRRIHDSELVSAYFESSAESPSANRGVVYDNQTQIKSRPYSESFHSPTFQSNNTERGYRFHWAQQTKETRFESQSPSVSYAENIQI